MVAKRIKGLLLGLSSSSRHSGGSTLAESDMLGHADTDDGGRFHKLGAFKEILTSDPRAWTGSSHYLHVCSRGRLLFSIAG